MSPTSIILRSLVRATSGVSLAAALAEGSLTGSHLLAHVALGACEVALDWQDQHNRVAE